MSSRATSLSVGRAHARRPSVSSRLSFAVSTVEQGEASNQNAPAERQIDEEIAEIKRYEVRHLGIIDCAHS